MLNEPETAVAEWRASWTLVAAATIGYSLAVVHASSIGVMMGPIERELGWTRTEIFSGVSLVSFVAMGLATFIGVAIDRYGPRRVGILATVLICGAVALMSTTTDSLWGWWARWVLVGVAVAAMPTVWVAPIAARFNVSRGLAMAIVLSGSGLGTFLVPMMTNTLVEQFGWRGAYLGLGAIWGTIALPVVLLFFHATKPTGNPGAEAAAAAPSTEKPSAAEPSGLTAREGFRSLTYYRLILAGTGATAAGGAMVLNLVPMLHSNGLSNTAAAAVAGLIGISTIIGRVCGGWLLDHFRAKWIACAATLLSITLPVTLLVSQGSVVAASAGVLIFGLVGGAKIAGLVYLATRHLGQRAFGTLYGAINACVAFGVGIAPLGANYVYDLTQSYELVMWAIIPVLVVSASLYASLGAYPDFETKAR